MRLLLLAGLILLVCTAHCYKFLIYNPFLGQSHVNFLNSIADVLIEGGHDVTVLMPEMDEELVNRTAGELKGNIIRSPGDPRSVKILKESTTRKNVWTMASSPTTMMQMTKSLSDIMVYQCETLMEDEKLQQRLREEKFDVAISEGYYVCALGLFEVLNIKTTLVALSNPHMDSVAYALGEPSSPSYVPGIMSTTGDKMTLAERFQNIFALFIGRMVTGYLNDNEVDVFRQKFGSFKHANELIAQASFVFTNANPFLDFPRPALQKTVMIGGFAVAKTLRKKQELPEEWSSFLDARKHTILVSFGSVAKSIDMPDNYKSTLSHVFASMPDVSFIWKYEDPNSTIAGSLPNVRLSAWVPQVPLLKDPRLSAFLTHGGIGSTNEVAYTGKPAIMIPIFGDQMRNAHMLARQGGALVLDKTDLGDADKLRSAFKEVIENRSYANNALLLSQMLNNQPILPEQLLLSYAGFAAKFGQLPNIDSYGRHLSVIQYYSIDIFTIIALVLVSVLILIVFIVKKCYSCSFSKQKSE